jgi:glycosyltransferase involved in cell wall biosynthesis
VKSPDICEDVCLETGTGLDLVGDTSITGEPDYLEKCKRKADGKQIKIVGGVTRGEAVWWYSQSKALLHLTKNFREPFGLAPVEAMACETPVLAWNYGALRETVKDKETGFLVTSEREAVQIIKDGGLDQIDRKKCREWASQFSVDRMILGYERLCVEAIEHGGW